VADLRCSIVAGAANNPLAGARVADELARAGILYVPDFLANCGGIIHVGGEILGFDDAEVDRRVTASIDRTARLLGEAQGAGRTPWDVAVELAEARIGSAPAVPVQAVA
jgi:glutamate dehydrogenase/leucine dehydrogenase